ncbi:hypothetical protein OIU77_009748 [Salix suchowensis]|uniref:Uncharacterized protein n=1 Tax=Salix suchowensis TaxID=1278906 RepID=A0ABQ9A750_9ROSI|nr:hypothetical protein OIU77_009748 [Salix suchowensis]
MMITGIFVRAASTRSNLGSRNKKINVDVPAGQQYSHTKSATRVGDNMPRSHSVPPIGRIDEETPCDFDEEDVKVKSSVCPRSRSYAVSKSSVSKSSPPIRFLFSDLKFYMEIVKRISVKSPITQLSLEPNLWWIPKSKLLILCPILGDAPHRRSSSDTARRLSSLAAMVRFG